MNTHEPKASGPAFLLALFLVLVTMCGGGKYLMWLVIVAIVVFAVVFAWRMAGEDIKKNNTKRRKNKTIKKD